MGIRERPDAVDRPVPRRHDALPASVRPPRSRSRAAGARLGERAARGLRSAHADGHPDVSAHRVIVRAPRRRAPRGSRGRAARRPRTRHAALHRPHRGASQPVRARAAVPGDVGDGGAQRAPLHPPPGRSTAGADRRIARALGARYGTGRDADGCARGHRARAAPSRRDTRAPAPGDRRARAHGRRNDPERARAGRRLRGSPARVAGSRVPEARRDGRRGIRLVQRRRPHPRETGDAGRAADGPARPPIQSDDRDGSRPVGALATRTRRRGRTRRARGAIARGALGDLPRGRAAAAPAARARRLPRALRSPRDRRDRPRPTALVGGSRAPARGHRELPAPHRRGARPRRAVRSRRSGGGGHDPVAQRAGARPATCPGPSAPAACSRAVGRARGAEVSRHPRLRTRSCDARAGRERARRGGADRLSRRHLVLDSARDAARRRGRGPARDRRGAPRGIPPRARPASHPTHPALRRDGC